MLAYPLALRATGPLHCLGLAPFAASGRRMPCSGIHRLQQRVPLTADLVRAPVGKIENA